MPQVYQLLPQLYVCTIVNTFDLYLYNIVISVLIYVTYLFEGFLLIMCLIIDKSNTNMLNLWIYFSGDV